MPLPSLGRLTGLLVVSMGFVIFTGCGSIFDMSPATARNISQEIAWLFPEQCVACGAGLELEL